MHTTSFGAMVLRTSNQPFWIFLSEKYQLVHIVVDNLCNTTEKGETQSCPLLSNRHKQRICVSYEFIDQISVRRWHKLVFARSVIKPAHNNLLQWQMLLCANMGRYVQRFNHIPSIESRKRHTRIGSKYKQKTGGGIKHKQESQIELKNILNCFSCLYTRAIVMYSRNSKN